MERNCTWKAGMNLRAIEEKFQVENVSKSIELQYCVDVWSKQEIIKITKLPVLNEMPGPNLKKSCLLCLSNSIMKKNTTKYTYWQLTKKTNENQKIKMTNPIGKRYQGKKSCKDTNMSRMKDKISLNIRMYLWDSELYHIIRGIYIGWMKHYQFFTCGFLNTIQIFCVFQ